MDRTGGLGKVPLVMHYHAIGTIARGDDPDNLAVPAERFRRQLEGLRRRGYEFLSLRDFVAQMSRGEPPSGACVLTFDDGTQDNLEDLPPILREFQAPATVFACPGLLGEPHPDYPPRAGMRYLTEDELRDLSALDLVEIGSHTSVHTDLGSATSDEAYNEMVSSKQALEDLLGEEVPTFAYPNGSYSPACPEAARRAGYVVAATCGPKRGGWLPYELRRESISSLDRRLAFGLKARGMWNQTLASAIGRVARPLGWRRPVTEPDASK